MPFIRWNFLSLFWDLLANVVAVEHFFLDFMTRVRGLMSTFLGRFFWLNFFLQIVQEVFSFQFLPEPIWRYQIKSWFNNNNSNNWSQLTLRSVIKTSQEIKFNLSFFAFMSSVLFRSFGNFFCFCEQLIFGNLNAFFQTISVFANEKRKNAFLNKFSISIFYCFDCWQADFSASDWGYCHLTCVVQSLGSML